MRWPIKVCSAGFSLSLALLILFLVVPGCAAYKSLIGHPISVLIRQHHDNEVGREYDRTNAPSLK